MHFRYYFNVPSGGGGRLNGLWVDDSIDGGIGNDSLEGFVGRDTLTGGSGNDVFIFAQPGTSPSTSASPDRITDFENGSDRIQLTGFGFTALSDFETLSHSGGVTTLADTQTSFTITFTGDVTGLLDNSDFVW